MGLIKARQFPRWPGSWTLAGVVALTSLAAQLGGAPLRDALMYDRLQVAGGQLHRLATGHVVHLDWNHLLLNLAGLLLVWILVGRQYSWLQWLLVAAMAAAVIDGGFWWFMPELRWYVGLSGVLHGLLLAGAVSLYRERRVEALVLGGVVTMKLLYEVRFGPMPGSADSIAGVVITEAHLFGAVGGTLAAALVLGWRIAHADHRDRA